MATLNSSFVSGASLSSFQSVVEPRSSARFHLRVVSKSSAPAMRGSEGNVTKPDGEVSKQTLQFIGTGIEKPGELWWAPLFNVSAEEQWSNLLTEEAKEQETERSVSSSPRLASGNTTALALPDLIDSQTDDTRRNSSRSRVDFTAEKARALRKSMRASETWHDGWYHSAIATRLAEPSD